MTKAIVKRCAEQNSEGKLHMDNINHTRMVLLEMYLNISTDLEHPTYSNLQSNLEDGKGFNCWIRVGTLNAFDYQIWIKTLNIRFCLISVQFTSSVGA